MNERRWSATIGVIALTTCFLASGGCEQPASEMAPTAAGMSTAMPPVAAAPGDVRLTVVDRAEFDRLLVARRGQVVFVDFWATWCLPCVEQFGHTVALAREHGDQGLAVMSVSLNDPTERDAIEVFLQRQAAGGIENLLSEYGAGPRSMEEFEIAGGALPYYQLYDRTGKLRYTFGVDPTGPAYTLEEVDARVTELLAEPVSNELP